MNIIGELAWRDAINQQTSEEGLRGPTENTNISLYCGVDPTGDSIHIGHLIPFMMMKRFQLAGHHPYILIGGGTGTIGDPGGRTTGRILQTMEAVQHNVDSLSNQIKKLFGKDAEVTMVNNYDWLSELSLLDFLRGYGKNFSVSTMSTKDIVASCLESGIFFTEFTYQVLQSVDFYTLRKKHNIQLQIGGADQWDSITAGLDLIRKKEGPGAKVSGLTIPLMLKADGTKFGKTAGGAVWLDPRKISPFEFYQFWLNQDDCDVIKYLKFFTFLGKEEIDALAEKVEKGPGKREAQRRLAEEVTQFIHDDAALEKAQKISEALFSGNIKDLTIEEIEQGSEHMPTVEITKDAKNIVDWLADTEIEPSERQAREDVSGGAISINGDRATDLDSAVDPTQHFDGEFAVVRKGKKSYFLVKVMD